MIKQHDYATKLSHPDKVRSGIGQESGAQCCLPAQGAYCSTARAKVCSARRLAEVRHGESGLSSCGRRLIGTLADLDLGADRTKSGSAIGPDRASSASASSGAQGKSPYVMVIANYPFLVSACIVCQTVRVLRWICRFFTIRVVVGRAFLPGLAGSLAALFYAQRVCWRGRSST